MQSITKDLVKRRKRWAHLQSHLTKVTEHKFDDMLNLNNYSGGLTFDHNGKSLDLHVAKDGAAGAVTDVKGLRYVERAAA